MKQNNACEVAAAELYKQEGWRVADSGWPDFLLYRWSGGRLEIKFSEVKSVSASLRENQKRVLTVLSALAPTVVCQEQRCGFQEKIVTPPPQDEYYHRTDNTEWSPCLNHEACSIQYHICEPRG